MTGRLLALAFCAFLTAGVRPAPAGQAATASVLVNLGNIKYVYRTPELYCGSTPAEGCTRTTLAISHNVMMSADGRRLINLNLVFSLAKIEVEVSTAHPKGSCMFDAVLKHELTHVALARAVVRRYAKEVPKEILARYEKRPFSFNDLEKVLKAYQKKMNAERDRQDALLDKEEAREQLLGSCKKPSPSRGEAAAPPAVFGENAVYPITDDIVKAMVRFQKDYLAKKRPY